MPSRLVLFFAVKPAFWWSFWILATVASALYAHFAFAIHSSKSLDKIATYPTAWRVHQWWFNFVGSLTGWIALSLLLEKLVYCAQQQRPPALSIPNAVVTAVAFIGITGYLPFLAGQVLSAVKDFVRKVIGAGSSKEQDE